MRVKARAATWRALAVTLEAPWQDGYKRQMEFYQWLLRRQGPSVARRGWFVYCNARRDLAAFDARLEFKIKLIAYDGGDAWVEGALASIHETLRAPEPPPVNEACEYCRYAARWGRECTTTPPAARDLCSVARSCPPLLGMRGHS